MLTYPQIELCKYDGAPWVWRVISQKGITVVGASMDAKNNTEKQLRKVAHHIANLKAFGNNERRLSAQKSQQS